MRKLFTLLCLGGFCFWSDLNQGRAAPSLTTPESAIKPIVTIGIVYDGNWSRFQGFDDLIKNEVIALTHNEWDVRFPKNLAVDGNWSKQGIEKGIKSLLQNPRVDIVITLGIAGSHLISQEPHLKKPVIAPLILDPKIQKIPIHSGKSGIKHLSYLVSSNGFERSLEAFHKTVPFKNLTILINKLLFDSIPTLKAFAHKNDKQTANYKIHVVPVSADVGAMINAIPKDSDAVILGPFLKLTTEELRTLSTALIQKKLPSFSFIGREEVEQGIMFSIAPVADNDRFARRIALIVQKILMGEEAGDQPVYFTEGEEPLINISTVTAIGARPSWEVLTEVEQIEPEKKKVEREISLVESISIAMQNSLSVLNSQQNLKAHEAEVKKARSIFFPKISAEYTAQRVDRKQAAASLGIIPEQIQEGHIKLNQAILSLPGFAKWSAEKNLRDGEAYLKESTGLDAGLVAARAYLNLLRAKSFERIRKSDLKLTRSNLDRAKARLAIGVANPSEVYRWENIIAVRKKEYLNAEAAVHEAEVALNVALNWRQNTTLELKEANLQDPLLLIGDNRLNRYLRDPWSVEIFNEFIVAEGLSSALELQRIEMQIKAADKMLSSLKRVSYVPEVSLEAKGTRLLSKDLKGDPLFPVENNKNSWTVGLMATLPLFLGGENTAAISGAQAKLMQLKVDYDIAKTAIEQRIRNALYQATASYAGIALSHESETAAQKSLSLITEAYTRGTLAVIDLIDAQNEAFAAKQGAANAEVDFLLDLMELQRAMGCFDYFLSENQRAILFKKLEAFFSANSGQSYEQK